MNLLCTRRDLADALALASGATAQRSSLPFLQNVALYAEEDSLRIVGCDGELWAQRKIPANVTAPGSASVQAALFSQYVGSLADGDIALTLEGNQLVIRSGHSEWKLLSTNPSDSQNLPEVAPQSELTLPFGELTEAIDSVAFAVAEDGSRPILTGVYLNYDGQKLTLVATDTHRLAVRNLDKDGLGSDVTAIVPHKALRLLRHLPFASEDAVTVRFDNTRLVVDTGDAQIVSQLLEGAYPNWERVVPQDPTRSWIVERGELLENVRRALLLAKDSAYRVRFKSNGEEILISARSDDKGEAKEAVGAVVKNGDLEIAFNGRYVVDALNAMKVDGVQVDMTESARPAVFRPVEGGEKAFCVIMPMALG